MRTPAFTLRAVLVCTAVAAAVAGCGSSATTSTASTTGAAAATSTAAPAAAGAGAGALAPTSTPLGQVLATSNGRIVYVLQKAGADVACAGACAAVWPPVTAGGKQVTAGGHPVYTFKGDSAAGQTNGQGVNSFGGTWHAVLVGGAPVPVASSSPSSGSTGGGYGGY
ncbi:MAG TPA: hypothetical protein VGN54_01170 [Mycobacteriales bacterium]|jgi:predicted lipoprotein with Yx(FWY)xxD motif|nr:hypothetical protein [Mycobacteriales bacterium]